MTSITTRASSPIYFRFGAFSDRDVCRPVIRHGDRNESVMPDHLQSGRITPGLGNRDRNGRLFLGAIPLRRLDLLGRGLAPPAIGPALKQDAAPVALADPAILDALDRAAGAPVQPQQAEQPQSARHGRKKTLAGLRPPGAWRPQSPFSAPTLIAAGLSMPVPPLPRTRPVQLGNQLNIKSVKGNRGRRSRAAPHPHIPLRDTGCAAPEAADRRVQAITKSALVSAVCAAI